MIELFEELQERIKQLDELAETYSSKPDSHSQGFADGVKRAREIISASPAAMVVSADDRGQ